MTKYLWVLLGGAVGSLIRYSLGLIILSRFTGPFPLHTFVINVSGSFLIGFAAKALSPAWRPLVIAGFLGGYTTFSAFEWEAFSLADHRLPWLAFSYLLASVAVGFVVCWIGYRIAPGH